MQRPLKPSQVDGQDITSYLVCHDELRRSVCRRGKTVEVVMVVVDYDRVQEPTDPREVGLVVVSL